MANTIQLKRGTGSSEPSTLAEGELAINLDSGKLFYGSGSSVLSDFTVETLTAETYVVSSSVTHMTTSFSSGSTAFGDSAGDAHTFTGDITASGDISASGALTGYQLSVNGVTNISHHGRIYPDISDSVFLSSDTGVILVNGGDFKVDGGDLNLVSGLSGGGHITASGNISASGTITALALDINGVAANTIDISSGEGNVAINASSTDADCMIRVQDNSTTGTNAMGIVATSDDFVIRNDEGNFKVKMANNATTTLDLNQSGDLSLTGEITASGNISSSGTIKGSSLIGPLATAAQTNITSVGTLGSLTVDTLNLNGNSIGSTADGDVYMTMGTAGFDFEANTGDIFRFNSYQNNVDFHYSGENDDNVFYIDASADKVGIGDATPTAKLDVAGNINTTSDITASGRISSSNIIYGTSFYAHGNVVGLWHGGSSTIRLANPGTSTSIYGSDITMGAPVTSSYHISSSGNIIANEFHGDGSNLTGLSGGTVGWHGSGTRIKILHSDFIPDDGGRPVMIDDTGVASEELFLESHASNTLYATMPIPTGYTATHVMIYGSAADAVEVWEHQINSKTGVSKGTGNVDTEIDITDVASTTTNYLFIQVANASGNEIHGGYITIAES